MHGNSCPSFHHAFDHASGLNRSLSNYIISYYLGVGSTTGFIKDNQALIHLESCSVYNSIANLLKFYYSSYYGLATCRVELTV